MFISIIPNGKFDDNAKLSKLSKKANQPKTFRGKQIYHAKIKIIAS